VLAHPARTALVRASGIEANEHLVDVEQEAAHGMHELEKDASTSSAGHRFNHEPPERRAQVSLARVGNGNMKPRILDIEM